VAFPCPHLLPLKHFATRQRHTGPHRPENAHESLGKTPSPGISERWSIVGQRMIIVDAAARLSKKSRRLARTNQVGATRIIQRQAQRKCDIRSVID